MKKIFLMALLSACSSLAFGEDVDEGSSYKGVLFLGIGALVLGILAFIGLKMYFKRHPEHTEQSEQPEHPGDELDGGYYSNY